ncbi:hypothetical protein OCU04_006774 [Sclerotinia nivalis]|uniref:Uncharacterized protein n=1 Tax=Sclerotinia nivalis TaxID=352851 RepID=A0A9X0AKJ6_9HELO|nr:hypothetical protein OCU04_006774 [Sclerotinia nivalis]
MRCPEWDTSRKTCVQYRAEDKKPEATTIPKIDAKLIEGSCGDSECIRLLTLPECKNPHEKCEIKIFIYTCGQIIKEPSRACAGCGTSDGVSRADDKMFVATTRPRITPVYEYQKRPKIEGVCDKYQQHEERRRERQIIRQQEAEEAERTRAEYERNRQFERDRQKEVDQHAKRPPLKVTQKDREAYGYGSTSRPSARSSASHDTSQRY